MTPNPDPYDLARAEAQRLRREAIDDFWRGSDAVLDRVWMTTRMLAARSALRLQARLARRTRRQTQAL